jgi:hypothetical protein
LPRRAAVAKLPGVQTDLHRTEAEALEERRVHGRALSLLQEAGLEPMVGGAYALKTHTGLWRDTKDLDLFLRKDRIHEALDVLARAGYRTEFTDPMWIAKAYGGPYFIDLIFCSGNGIGIVDAKWRERAATATVLDLPSLIVPAEEMIWQKAFIQERERFDGADIHHLIRCKGAQLDWKHLLHRFEPHWQVLFVHLITFRFAFPSDKDQIPGWVMEDLTSRLARAESVPASAERVCRGTLLSRQQYLFETNTEGYRDTRETETPDWPGDTAYPVKYPASH